LGVKKKRAPWGKLPPLLQFKLGISVRNIVSKRKNLKTRLQEGRVKKPEPFLALLALFEI